MRTIIRNTPASLLVLLLLCCISSQSAANAVMLQNAYRQLQRFSIKDDEQSARVEALQAVQELSLEQLKEEAELIETDIFNIKKDIDLAEDVRTVNYSRLKQEDLSSRMATRQMEQSNWQLKKDLSEEASIQLSRERLLLQEKIRKNNGTDYPNQEKARDDQKLHNLALKIRFSELYQSLATKKIEGVKKQIIQITEALNHKKSKNLRSVKLTPVDDDEPAHPAKTDAETLKERLSQTRRELLQLQNLHFELMYQIEKVQNVELLYQMMLRQKHRLKAIPDSLNASLLTQDLTIRRFQLFEKKAELVTRNNDPKAIRELAETIVQVEQMLQTANELQKLEAELHVHQHELLLILDQKQLLMPTAPTLGPSGLFNMLTRLSQQIPNLLTVLFGDWFFWLALFTPLYIFIYRLSVRRWRHHLPSINYHRELKTRDWYRICALLLLQPSPLLLASLLVNYFDGNHQTITGSWMSGILLITYCWSVFSSLIKHRGIIKVAPVFKESCHPFRSSLILSSLSGLWLAAFAQNWYENPFDNYLGQLTLVLCGLWQFIIFWRWKSDFSLKDWRGFLPRIFTLLALSTSILSACFGYLQVSWLTFNYLQMLLLFAACLWLMYLTANYQLYRRTRQMTAKHAMALKKESDDNPSNRDAVKASREKVQNFESQGRVILNLLLSLIALAALVTVWKALSPLLSPVSETLIFSFSEGPGKLGIALGTVGNVVLILITSWLVARNLPGLLQILLPEQMIRQSANTYIYNRILSYLIWAIGITTALGQIGIPWDKVQWFVLAIVVGLGLGLQDIVANFFSGLILLLERPIRVGDTVTIEEREGTVRKISIRATVIETFDRIELIVPNRILISNQLTNWSLSSFTIRLSLWYGVEHNSDHLLVNRLLVQAAQESRLVLTHPKPESSFFEYTEHSQRYELRIYLNHADHRFPARNQVNCRIQELFREHGVNIAHLQHDLYLSHKNPSGNSSSQLPGAYG